MAWGDLHIADAKKERRKINCARCGKEYYARARAINTTGVSIKTKDGLLLYRQASQEGKMFYAKPVNLCTECASQLDEWFENADKDASSDNK